MFTFNSQKIMLGNVKFKKYFHSWVCHEILCSDWADIQPDHYLIFTDTNPGGVLVLKAPEG